MAEQDFDNLSNEELLRSYQEDLANQRQTEQGSGVQDAQSVADHDFSQMSNEELLESYLNDMRSAEGANNDANNAREDYGFMERQSDQITAEGGRDTYAGQALIEGVTPFTRAMRQGKERDEDRELGAWLSDGEDNTLRVALKKHGLERDPSLEGYKAKETGGFWEGFSDDMSRTLAQLPFGAGWLFRKAREADNPQRFATDHLMQSAFLSGFSRADIEQAKEFSQGDPAKMYDFFAERVEKRLKGFAAKKQEKQEKLAAHQDDQGFLEKVGGGTLGMAPMLMEFALGGAAGKALEGVTGYAKLLKALPNNWRGRLARGFLSDAGDVGVLGSEFTRRRYGELTADEYGVDEDGNLLKKEGDTPERALVKAAKGGFGEVGIYKKLGGLGANWATPMIAKTIRTKVGQTAAKFYENYVKYGQMTGLRGQPQMLALMDLNAFKDEVLGYGVKDADYEGREAAWQKFKDETLSIKGQTDLFVGALGVMLAQGSVAGANAWRQGRAQKLSNDRRLRAAFNIPQEQLDKMEPELKRMLVRVGENLYNSRDAFGRSKVRAEQNGGKNAKGDKYGTIRDSDGNVISDGTFEDRLKRWCDKVGERLGKANGEVFDEAGKYALEFDNSYNWEKDAYPGQYASRFKVPSMSVRDKDGKLTGYDVAWEDVDVPLGGDKTIHGQQFTDPNTGISVLKYIQTDAKGGDNGYIYLITDENGHRATRFGQADAMDAAKAMDAVNQRNVDMRGMKAQMADKIRASIPALEGADMFYAKDGAEFDAVLSDVNGEPVETGSGVRGVTLPNGRVMLCLDRIENPQQMKDTMLHEAGRHRGLDLALPDVADKMGFVAGLAKSGDPVVQNQLNRIIEARMAKGELERPEDIFKRDKDGNYLHANALEEVYAHLFDRSDVPEEAGWWDAHMNAMRRNIRKVFKGLSYSRSEAEEMYRGAMEKLKDQTGFSFYEPETPQTPPTPPPSGERAEQLQREVSERRAEGRAADFAAAERELGEQIGDVHEQANANAQAREAKEASMRGMQEREARKAAADEWERSEAERKAREAREEQDAAEEAEIQRLIEEEERETDMAKREEYQKRRREITERRAKERAESAERERHHQERVLSAIDRAKEAERLDKKRKLAKATEIADHERRLKEAEDANDLAAYRAEESRWAEANRSAAERREQEDFDKNQGRIEEERARAASSKEDHDGQNSAEVGAEGAGARGEAETGKEMGAETERVEGVSGGDGGDMQNEPTENGKTVPLHTKPITKSNQTEKQISKPKQEIQDETGHGTDEAQSQPEQGTAERTGEVEAPRPVAGAEKGGEAAREGVVEGVVENATWIDLNGKKTEMDGWDAPSDINVAKGATIAVKNDRNTMLYDGEVVSVGPKNVKIKTDGGMGGGETVLTFPRKDIVGVKRPAESAKSASNEPKRNPADNFNGYTYDDYGAPPNTDEATAKTNPGGTGDVIGSALLSHRKESKRLFYIPESKDDPLWDWYQKFNDGNARKNRRGDFIALFGMNPKKGRNDAFGDDLPPELWSLRDKGAEAVAEAMLKARKDYAEWVAKKRNGQREAKAERAEGDAAFNDEAAERAAAADLSLESMTPEQAKAEEAKLAEQKRKAEEMTEIERRNGAPLKGGGEDVRQGKLDLGGAEGEDTLWDAASGELIDTRTGEILFFDSAEEARDTDLDRDRDRQYRDWLAKYRLADSEKHRREWERKNPAPNYGIIGAMDEKNARTSVDASSSIAPWHPQDKKTKYDANLFSPRVAEALDLINDEEFRKLYHGSKADFIASGTHVLFSNSLGDDSAAYDKKQNVIYVNTKNFDNTNEIARALKHELTHVRQVREGKNEPEGFDPHSNDLSALKYLVDPGELEAKYAEEGKLDEFANIMDVISSPMSDRMEDVEIGEMQIVNWNRNILSPVGIRQLQQASKTDRIARDILRRAGAETTSDLLPAKLEEIGERIMSDDESAHVGTAIGYRVLNPAAYTQQTIKNGRIRLEVLGRKDTSTGKRKNINPVSIARKLSELGVKASAVGPNEINIFATPETVEKLGEIRKMMARALPENGGSVNSERNFDINTPKQGVSELRYFNIDEEAGRRVHAKDLDEARRMEGAGAGRREIWEKTGWWKAKDGKWRYEIAGISDADTKRMLDFALASGKFYDRDRANVYSFTLNDLEAAMREKGERLPDSVKTLLAAYPKLGKETIEVDRMAAQPMDGTLGYATKGKIHLYERGTTAETLNHELQHRIQAASGMAGGTNTDGKSFGRYTQEHGEWEARQAATRAGMDADERGRTAPWETEDRHGVAEDMTQIDDANRARIRPDGEPEEQQPAAAFMDDNGDGLKDKAKRLAQKYMTEVVDKLNPIRQMEIGAGKRKSEDLFVENSPYNAQRLLPGKQEAAKKRYEDIYKKPFMKMLGESGATVEDVGMYMIAMNAKDRNRKILERYGVLDGAGLSDADADKLLQDLRNHLGREKMGKVEKMADLLWKMQKEGMARRVESGRVSKAVAEQWEKEEPHHVPMRDDLSNENGEYNRSTRRWTRNDLPTARGRHDMSDNPVEFMFMEYQDAMYGANANEARRKLADFVRSTPGIGKISRGIRFGRDGFPDPNWREQTVKGGAGRPNLVSFKENGELYTIELNGKLGEQVAEAVTGRGVRQAWKPYQSVMRAYSSTATELSPAFGGRNFMADMLEASLNTIADKGLIKGGVAAVKNAVNAVRAMPTITHWLRTGEYKGAFADSLRRYVESGSLIGGMGNEGFSEIKGEAEKASLGKKSAADMVRLVMRPIELYNKTIELGTRLAVFKDYLDGGASEGEAAMRSREYSTDFNKYGNQRWLNSLFMFSGSVVGGAVRQTASLVRGKTGKQLATGLFTYGVLEALAELFFNEDDDEKSKKSGQPSGDTMTEYQRANSLYFRVGDKFIRIPFHAGPFSVIKYAGNLLARAAFGDMKPGEAWKNLLKEAGSIGMHFTGTGDFNWDAKVQSLTPTLLVPFLQAKSNEDFAGKPIRKQMYSETKPFSENGRKDTGETWKLIASGVNAMSGGNEKRRGLFDYSPEMYKHWFDALGKNLTRDISSVVDLVTDIKDGKSIGDVMKENSRHVLFAGDVVRNVPDNTNNFYDAKNRYQTERADGTIKQGSRRDEAVKKLLREIDTLRHWEAGEEKKGGKWVPMRKAPSESAKEKNKKMRLKYQQQVINLMNR